MARQLNNLEETLTTPCIKQLLKEANKSKITRVCREIRLTHKPNVYHRSKGDSLLPTVDKAVRMGRAPLSPQLRKGRLHQ